MIRPVNCGLCGEHLGNYHGCDSRAVITQHFRERHPKELAELKTAKIVLSNLKIEHTYRGYL